MRASVVASVLSFDANPDRARLLRLAEIGLSGNSGYADAASGR